MAVIVGLNVIVMVVCVVGSVPVPEEGFMLCMCASPVSVMRHGMLLCILKVNCVAWAVVGFSNTCKEASPAACITVISPNILEFPALKVIVPVRTVR